MSKKVIRINSCSDCPHNYYSAFWTSYVCLKIGTPGIPSLCPDKDIREDCPLEDDLNVKNKELYRQFHNMKTRNIHLRKAYNTLKSENKELKAKLDTVKNTLKGEE